MISERMHDIERSNLKGFAKNRREIMEKISKNEETGELLRELRKSTKKKLRRDLSKLIKKEEGWEKNMEIVEILQIDQEEANEVWKTLDENIKNALKN